VVVTFAYFKKGGDVVIVKNRFGSHMLRFDAERQSWRRCASGKQARSKQIVQHLPKGNTSGTGFLFYALQHILVKRNRRSDAHDVIIVAS
jgi:hypothetical protein